MVARTGRLATPEQLHEARVQRDRMNPHVA